jgi:putative transposase
VSWKIKKLSVSSKFNDQKKLQQKRNTLMEKHDIFSDFRTGLEEILREGARKLLQQAIENEVNECLEMYKGIKNEEGRKTVKRNGYLPKRKIQTGIGSVSIEQPRVRGVQFSSAILPKYLRRVPTIDALVPALYLKGISTGDMQEALEAILGKDAKGLSPTNIVRIKELWETEYAEWTKRDLSSKHYAYIWADGIYFNVRLTDERPCLLVIMGATTEGKKELLAIHDGIRESKLSWQEVLQDLKRRGLSKSPSLAIGDGALGFWAALEEQFPLCRHQRCWVHKTANVLDKMSKSAQGYAKNLIHEMYMSPTKIKGLQAFESFISLYEAKFPKACECLKKDKERLFTFYEFPAMHWQHIRTTNPIESTFATIRHRSQKTKGCGSRAATLAMVYKLGISAEKSWRRLKGHQLIAKVIDGVKFKDGEEVKEKAA